MGIEDLTEAQREVLPYMALDLTDAEIGIVLGRSHGSIQGRVSAAIKRADVHGRYGLVLAWWDSDPYRDRAMDDARTLAASRPLTQVKGPRPGKAVAHRIEHTQDLTGGDRTRHLVCGCGWTLDLPGSTTEEDTQRVIKNHLEPD